MAANGYPTLTDDVEEPDTVPALINTNPIIPVINGVVPSGWMLTASTYTTTGSLLQKLFEVFTNEREFLYHPLMSTYLSRQFYFDVADPQFAWIVESVDLVESLYVLTELGSSEILRADSDLDLFYSGDWKWKQEGQTVLIYGLGLQKTTTRAVTDNWQVINNIGLFEQSSTLFFEHPVTKNWFPIHPTQIRSDGMVRFIYDGVARVRSLHASAMTQLEEVTVYVNGEQKLARRVELPNSLDEKALYFYLNRRFAETNKNFEETILKASWFRSQSLKGVRNYISASLRTGILSTVSAEASGFTIPASSTGYSVRNINQYGYMYEQALTPTTSGYLSLFAAADMGCGYVRGLKTDFTTTASGVIIFDTNVDVNVDTPIIHWRIPYWTEVGSSVLFSDNWQTNIPDLQVFFPSKVRVNRPSTDTLKKSFNRTSPIFRWRSYIVNDVAPEIAQGLADFDF